MRSTPPVFLAQSPRRAGAQRDPAPAVRRGPGRVAGAGEQFRRAGIPLDRAFTCRYCRAIESAAFFVDNAEPINSLSGEADVGKNPAQKARAVAFLSQRPAPGRNHFMMAHGGIFWETTGFMVQEAHAVVLDPAHLRVVVGPASPRPSGAAPR